LDQKSDFSMNILGLNP